MMGDNMDSTVIEEIAKQLGMAVDQAGAFIAEHLPDYAALMALKTLFPLQLGAAVAAVSLVVAVVTFIVCKYPDDSVCFNVSAATFIISLILIALYALFYGADIIGWQQYPEAMLIDKALGAVL